MPVKSCTEQPLLSGFFEKKYYSQFCRTSVRTAREAAVLIPVGWKCVRAVTYPISFSLATNSSIAHIPATPQGYAALRALTPQFSETKKVLFPVLQNFCQNRKGGRSLNSCRMEVCSGSHISHIVQFGNKLFHLRRRDANIPADSMVIIEEAAFRFVF